MRNCRTTLDEEEEEERTGVERGREEGGREEGANFGSVIITASLEEERSVEQHWADATDADARRQQQQSPFRE